MIPFVFFSEEETEGGSSWITSNLWSSRSPIFWTSQSCSLSSNWFFRKCQHPFIDKLMVICEPAVGSTRLLGLGLKLYSVATCRAYTRQSSYSIHAESFLSTPKLSKRKTGSANRVIFSVHLLENLFKNAPFRRVRKCKSLKWQLQLTIGFWSK